MAEMLKKYFIEWIKYTVGVKICSENVDDYIHQQESQDQMFI